MLVRKKLPVNGAFLDDLRDGEGDGDGDGEEMGWNLGDLLVIDNSLS